MLKSAFRLYTRASEWQKTIISLDITPRDFHSESLELYVTRWFIDVDDFIDYLITSTDIAISLIVSNFLADIVIHIIRPLLPQISNVYILGPHLGNARSRKQKNQHFLDVESLLYVLVRKIEQNVNPYIRHLNQQSTNDLTVDTAKYAWHQFFFNILSHLNHTNVAQSEMFKAIRAFHPSKMEKQISRNCKDFERDYEPENIIRWYTRHLFFYGPLNKALRSENINHIFAFRYVLSDLERSLNHLQSEPSSIKCNIVYRGQKIHINELNSIRANIGNLIGMTSLWPATACFNTAYRAATWELHHPSLLESVIFIINTPSDHHCFTFTDISHLSSHRRKQQIIFPFRSLFRIEVVNNLDKVWHIVLTLVDNNDDQFIRIMQFGNTSSSLRSFFSLPNERKQPFFHDLSEENAGFLRFQLLIDTILRLHHNEFARDEMLEMCKAKFASNPAELAKIDIFERSYVGKVAIPWYTKDCFLYRLLNESLRTESIDLIVKLRYFIYDLHNELAELQLVFLQSLPPDQPTLKLYRGLTMTLCELETFRQNETNFVSTNSFLSTTRDYQAALFFSGEGNVEDSQVSVVYEISVDTSIAHSVPFAAIEYKSIHMDEDEVLFSMAAVFRIGRIEQINERLWKIDLTLTPSTEGHWDILTAHLTK
jgi:hypothetical protein